MSKTIEASLLAFNLKNINAEVKELKDSQINSIHYDVMDHKFVNHSAFDNHLVKPLYEMGMKVNVHFMVNNPKKWIKKFIHLPVNSITFHAEPISIRRSLKTIKYVHKHHILCGIAIKPYTNANKYKELLKKCDLVTIMGVEPGEGGQKFISYAINNLKIVNNIKDKSNNKLNIQLDGGINYEVIDITKKYVDCFVSGSFLMKLKNKLTLVKYINQK